MERQVGSRKGNRCRTVAQRVSVISAVAALGLALGPLAAHADTVRSATATGWGTNWDTATANAEANANGALYDLARSYGETCTGVTYTAYLYYIVPGGGGYVFSATATGDCAAH
jgi:hypothetical protein